MQRFMTRTLPALLGSALFCVLYANSAEAVSIIAQYGFDSDVVTDNSSNGHTLINSGGVDLSPLGTSAFGDHAAFLNGSNFLYTPDVDPFNFGTGPFAIGFWFWRATDDPNNVERTGVIVSKGDAGGAAADPLSGYVAHLDPLGSVPQIPEMRFYFNNDKDAGVSAVAGEIDWRHYVVQRDADGLMSQHSQGGGGASTVETFNFADVSSLSMAFAIGAGSVSTTGSGAVHNFFGYIDEVWVFDDALDVTQINNLFNFNDINGQVQAEVVPEPSTIVLLACGVLLSAGALRRQRRKRPH